MFKCVVLYVLHEENEGLAELQLPIEIKNYTNFGIFG